MQSPGGAGAPVGQTPMLTFGEPGKSLPFLLESKGLSIVDVVPESGNTEELVRMIFTLEDERKPGSGGGWLILDPAHHWLIRKGELDLVYDARTKIRQQFEYKYREGSDRFYLPTSQEFRATVTEDGRKTAEYEIVGTFDVREQADVPKSEFRFSAFGFPEPAGLKPRQTPWYLWLAGAGIVCVLCGFLLRRLAARTKVAST